LIHIKDDSMSGTTSFQNVSKSQIGHALSLTQDLLDLLLERIESISAFTIEKDYLWNQDAALLTTNISAFVEITTLLSKNLMTKDPMAMTRIKDSHVHLLSILKGMNVAQSKSDTVVLEDLIKYELKDNLTQWKIDLIPLTKSHLNN
jgi:hypothetical protein